LPHASSSHNRSLKNLCASEASWRGRVSVISSDMRQLQLATAPSSSSPSPSAAPAPLHTVVPAYGGSGGSSAHRGPLTVDAADIIISELLGSFGDNELSPECLDGVMRFLKPAPPPSPPGHLGAFPPLGGVSIPSAYTSFLAPVTSHKLWNEARGFGSATREETKWLETAYVVRMWRYHRLGPPQPAFTFAHPGPELAAPDGAPDNRRYVRLTWTMPRAGGGDASSSGGSGAGLDPVAGVGHLLHGFGGYFDATLYAPPPPPPAAAAAAASASTAPPPPRRGQEEEVHISTEPHSHTRGMFSWFPLFFPLRQPVYVAPGDVIELHMWRCVSASKVWYEWALGSPAVTPVHNPAGRSYAIGL
jgi:type II protein arginine methyltransferase